MLHGILIALAVPDLAGMIYSSPPDAGTASDAPGVDGIVKGLHYSAHPFESAVRVNIGVSIVEYVKLGHTGSRRLARLPRLHELRWVQSRQPRLVTRRGSEPPFYQTRP